MSVQWTPLRLVVGDSTEKKLSEERRNNNISTSKFASQVDVYSLRQGSGPYSSPFNSLVTNGHAAQAGDGVDGGGKGQGDFSSQPTLPSEYRKAINEKHRTRSVVLTKADLEPTPRTKTDGSEPTSDIYIKKCRDSKVGSCNGAAYPPLPIGPPPSQENVMGDEVGSKGRGQSGGSEEPPPPPKKASSIEKIPWDDMTDTLSHKSLEKEPIEEEGSCVVNCLYYTMQCCDCVLM